MTVKQNNIKLAVVGSVEEAKEALEISKDSTIFLATNLPAEFYLEKAINNYVNPLYDLVLKSKTIGSKDYIFPNFDKAYDFCNDFYLKYFRDRLGYFLAELDRSLDLAKLAIKEFRPKNLIIGEIKNYPGSSVVDGTLKTNAFSLLAKSRKIPYRLIADEKRTFPFRQVLGRKIQFLRYLKKQRISDQRDLLILVTPRHLIQMAPIITEIKNNGISVAILTYNVTLAFKGKLDRCFLNYFEKERLVNSEIKKEAEKLNSNLIRNSIWEKFVDPKYAKTPEIINYIRQKIEDIIRNELPKVLTDLVLAGKVLRSLKPKALLVTTDPDSNVLPYINTAKDLGIKTICIQHGAFYGKDSPSTYPVSDFFIVWSNTAKSWLRRTDYFKKVKMLVGKSPFHYLNDHIERKGVAGQLTILYLATKQPTVEKGLVTFYQRKLFDTLSKVNTDFRLLVRGHPYQDMSNLESLIKNFNHQASFANDQPLKEVISQSDFVIFENTTAGFDAMLAGKPTIYFNPYTGEDFFNVRSYDASLAILNASDLQFGLPKFVRERRKWQEYSRRGRAFAKKYLGLDYPMSRTAQIIKELIN